MTLGWTYGGTLIAPGRPMEGGWWHWSRHMEDVGGTGVDP